MIIQLLVALGVITTVIALILVFKKDLSLPENKKLKNSAIGLLVVTALSFIGIGQSVAMAKKGFDLGLAEQKGTSPTVEATLKAEIAKKDEQIAVMTEKLRVSVEQARQAKAETELHTTNVVKLQEEILRRNDEFSLLKEELDLRYKVDADKLLRENEDKFRKSAAAEAQKILENDKLKARVKVARDDIESKIVSNWTPPKDKNNMVVVVQYSINDQGKPTDISFKQKSGSNDVDASVIDAINAANPLPLSQEEAVRNATKNMVSKFVLP